MTWNLVAHRSELATPEDYVLLSAGADQLLAYNDAGTILIGDNVCLHRGSRIFSGTHGNAPLKCPYHGFTGERIQKAQFLTAWLGDWLFTGDGSTRIEDDLGDLGAVLSGISDKISRRHSFDMLPMSCDWKVAVENALEDLHIPTVHPDTFGKLGLKSFSATQHGRNSVAHYAVTDDRTVRGLTALARNFEDVDPLAYFHILLWPGTCISSVGGFTFSVQNYMPSGGFTMLHSRLYAAKTKPGCPNLDYFFNEASNFNRMVFQQDSAACANVVSSGTYLTESEERVKWFRHDNNQAGS